MYKQFLATLGLLILFAFSSNTAFAGGAKLNASFKFDGQPLRTGPHKGFNMFTHAKQSDDAAVLGISLDGNWLFVWSDSGDGWAPTSSMNVEGDLTSLSFFANPMRGYTFKPEGFISRPTDLKTGANSAYDTLVCIPSYQYVKVLAQSEDGHWLFVWSDAGDGWVPRSAVTSDADFSFLAVWHGPMAMATPLAFVE